MVNRNLTTRSENSEKHDQHDQQTNKLKKVAITSKYEGFIKKYFVGRVGRVGRCWSVGRKNHFSSFGWRKIEFP